MKSKNILFNTDLYDYIQNNREDINQFIKDEGLDPQPNTIEEAAGYLLEIDYNQLKDALQEYDYKNKNIYDYILVCADLGLWYGHKQAKKRFNSLRNAVSNALQYDTQIFYFNKVNGTLQADDYHHDGVNNFKFYKVIRGKKYAIKYEDIIKCY